MTVKKSVLASVLMRFDTQFPVRGGRMVEAQVAEWEAQQLPLLSSCPSQ